MVKKFICICLLTSVVASTMAQDGAGDLITQLKKSKQDTVSVNLLLQLSEYYFFKPSTNAKDLDSSLWYGYTARNLSNTLQYQRGLGNSYEQISKVLHKKNNITQGKYYANKAIEIFKANNYFLELGYAYYDLSGYYSIDSNKDIIERIRIVEQFSLPAFQQSGNKLKEADVLKELGDLKQLHGDYLQALTVLNHALQLYKSIGYTHLQGIYNLLGAIYNITGNNEQALQYGLLAINAAGSMNDTSLALATTYNRIASTYRHMKKYELAYEYFEKALTVAKKYNDTGTIILLTSHISRTLILMDQPHAALAVLQEVQRKYSINDIYLKLYITASYLITYEALKQYKTAQTYCDSLIFLSKKLDPGDPDQTEAQYPVTEFYIATHQYGLAQKNLVLTNDFYTSLHTSLDLARNELLWFKLDSIQGNYTSAIVHYQKYKQLEDSSLNQITRNHIEQLQIEFETEKKDQNIKLLENESTLQQGKLTQANQTRNWITGVALLLLVISVLMMNYSRLKQRTNKKLKSQQIQIENKNIALQHLVKEKEWLVKEIHHRVKNNFHIVIGLLGTQSSYLKTEEAINAMSESQNRIFAMSLIHQKLYQSENLTAINMVDYIHELVNHLRDSFNIRQSVHFKLQVHKIELGLAYSIPLGLILNEAITNSIKYAFAKNDEGVIDIIFKRKSQNSLLLIISDNGVGLPLDFDVSSATSMGMKLMKGLSEDIDGRFEVINHDGTVINLEFKYE